jgi:hypothetical protein
MQRVVVARKLLGDGVLPLRVLEQVRAGALDRLVVGREGPSLRPEGEKTAPRPSGIMMKGSSPRIASMPPAPEAQSGR